ncbi:MAG: murein L,D-transpeptidase [Micavibrio aeruginosavorus]|uniref:Murein L,D-transpeptidase n=1 Tax=Micavibrio aeruginosavorus TaxID=349221 RepID=A0A2W5MX79_9BACT|nr:MAG: murein L,D-transpeptidase [Micavibrio aeruginosavorus]
MSGRFRDIFGKTALLGALLGVIVLLATPVFSQPQVMAGELPGSGKYLKPDILKEFYEQRGWKPVWLRGSGSFQPRVDAMIRLLDDSWTHGLNPERYRLSEIKELRASAKGEDRLTLDIVLSDAAIRYVNDLTGMRGLRESGDRKIKYWREPLDANAILTLVSDNADPIAKLRALEPSNNLYQSLRSELVRLTALSAEENTQPVSLKAPLRPGKTSAQAPLIRARLGLPVNEAAPHVYDEPLAVAVMKLQKANGVDTDGVIWGRTLEILNMTREAKIWQILVNMERLRWVSMGRPDKYVLVNIPSASLWAVEGGSVKLEMPVIIGKTARPTYSFKTEITGVRFNPNWTVPPTIKNKDFLPMLQQDPEALVKRGIRITYQGKEVDPTKVDWATVTSKGLANVKMIQSPGDDNPLGKVRVIMENPYNIYLHDTNHREMFEQGERALSSGCIRVSQPEKLADFILSENEGWSWDKMSKMIDSGRMRDVPTETPIPVFITYQTVWLDSDGRLVYGRDVYGQDANLAEILKKAGAVHLPQQPEKI